MSEPLPYKAPALAKGLGAVLNAVKALDGLDDARALEFVKRHVDEILSMENAGYTPAEVAVYFLATRDIPVVSTHEPK